MMACVKIVQSCLQKMMKHKYNYLYVYKTLYNLIKNVYKNYKNYKKYKKI